MLFGVPRLVLLLSPDGGGSLPGGVHWGDGLISRRRPKELGACLSINPSCTGLPDRSELIVPG